MPGSVHLDGDFSVKDHSKGKSINLSDNAQATIFQGPQVNISEGSNTPDHYGLPVIIQSEYNSSQSGDTTNRVPCAPRTRLRILQRLDDWHKDPSSPLVYWMNGMAGTGKTTISYSLCEAAKNKDYIMASFFCTRTRDDCRDVLSIFPTLAYQLARSCSPFEAELKKVLLEDPAIWQRKIGEQFTGLIVRPLLLAMDRFLSGAPPPLIVVDGLDECRNPNAAWLIFRALSSLELPMAENMFSLMPEEFKERFISEEVYEYDARDPRKNERIYVKYNIPPLQSVIKVKFYIASRPDRRAETDHGLQERTSLFRLHEVNRDIVQNDIEEYLRQSLRDYASPTEIRALAKQASNLFIYAATAVRYIISPRSFNPRGRLQRMLDISNIQSESVKSSKELDALYHIIMDFLFDEELEEDEKQNRREILHAVVFSMKPLTTSTHASILQLEEDVVEHALYPVHSVIHFSAYNEPVSPLHASFADYLSDPRRSLEYYYDPSLFHSRHAIRCIKVLIQYYRKGCHLRFMPVKEQLETIRNSGHLGVNIQYASKYWVEHLHQGDPNCLDLTDIEVLYRFLTEYYESWLQTLLEQSLLSGLQELYKKIHTWVIQSLPMRWQFFKLRDAILRLRSYTGTLQCYRFCCFAILEQIVGRGAVASIIGKQFLPVEFIWGISSVRCPQYAPTCDEPSAEVAHHTKPPHISPMSPSIVSHSWINRGRAPDVQLLGENQCLLTYSSPAFASLWNLPTSLMDQTMGIPLLSIYADVCAVSPDGQYIMTLARHDQSESTIDIWCISAESRGSSTLMRRWQNRIWRPMMTLQLPLPGLNYTCGVTSAIFSPDNSLIVVVMQHRCVVVGAWQHREVSAHRPYSRYMLKAYGVSPTGGVVLCIASQPGERLVAVWKKQGGGLDIEPISEFTIPSSSTMRQYAHVFSKDEDELYFMSSPTDVYCWSLKAGEAIRSFQWGRFWRSLPSPFLGQDRYPVLVTRGSWMFFAGSQYPCVYTVLDQRDEFKLLDCFGTTVCYSLGKDVKVIDLQIPPDMGVLRVTGPQHEFVKRIYQWQIGKLH